MVAARSVDTALGSRLVQLVGMFLKDWATELQECPGTIVAISRKGPRLLELLVREGFLPESALSRVIAEQALPFLTRNDNEGFVAIDDAMAHGSTFASIYELMKLANIRCGGDDSKLKGIPFALGQEASKEHRKRVTKSFLDLKPDQIAPFVNNEISAFRLLGKPYDIEHPMLTLTGDFNDPDSLEKALNNFTKLLDGQKFNIDTWVPTKTGGVPMSRWTILLPTGSRYNSYPNAAYRKLRIYLNPERDRLLVVAMSLLSLNKDDMDSLGKILPAPLNQLWIEAAGKIDTKTEEPIMTTASSRSLAMWANFLFSTILLRDVKADLTRSFESAELRPRLSGPRREDLQYLIGPDLSLRAESCLSDFFEGENADSTFAPYPPFDHTAEINEEKIPQDYAENYEKKLTNLLENSLGINDVLETIFCTQHTDIDLKSRGEANDDYNRLEFGLTYNSLRRIVKEQFPEAEEIDIHECLDRLIDNGSIVPRYLNMALEGEGKPAIWVRTFRVGERTAKDKIHTVRLLFKTLSNVMKTEELPALVFEKYCTLALCVATEFKDLEPLQSLETKKLFHLYGARPAVELGGRRKEFLTDWAVRHRVLSRKGANTELNGRYSLNQDIEVLYPPGDCTWDDHVKDSLEDIATLVAAIHKKYNDDMLVALTTLASEQELQRAIEEELQLWIYDQTASVYKGLEELDKLAKLAAAPTEIQLKDVNSVLSKMANFTAQVTKKVQVKEKLEIYYEQIEELSAANILAKRSWRDLRPILEKRGKDESNSPGLQEIKSTLRIAHVTTRILRELLSLAGYKDEYSVKHSVGLGKSLVLLRELLDDLKLVDPVTMIMFKGKGKEQDIAVFLTSAQSQPMDNFKAAFPSVQKLVVEIANRCERVFKAHGIDSHKEKPELVSSTRYILMWDIVGSTTSKTREEIESLIGDANQRIGYTFEEQPLVFNSGNKDDGNNIICESFTDVLAVFQILNEVFPNRFRAGCEVNLQGQFNYYPKSKSLGGRAYEYAARVMAFYKEIKADPALWSGALLSEPAETSYMVVSEFAKRYAQKENAWPESEKYIIEELDGTYTARVDVSLPMTLTILKPPTSNPKV